jgi:hypothetical protein
MAVLVAVQTQDNLVLPIRVVAVAVTTSELVVLLAVLAWSSSATAPTKPKDAASQAAR